MAESQHDLGAVDEIDVEAIGEPGRRTFRLLVECGPTTVCLWMEKEQLEQLALIIEQQLARFGETLPLRQATAPTLSTRFPVHPTLEFKVGRMAVGFDAEEQRFALTAHPLRPEGQPAISCVASQAQAEALGGKIVAVAAAGRPHCPLCGAPMEGKHVCPLSNGHAQA